MTDDLMNRLHTLRSAGTAETSIPESTVHADVARGRRAARRATYSRGITALGALAVVGVLGATALHGTSPNTPRGPDAGASQSPTHRSEALKLVAYTGKQLGGYRVAQVPEGYSVVAADSTALVIGPPGDSGANPAAFADRVVVMTHSADAAVPTGRQVNVHGSPATLWDNEGDDGARTLTFTDQLGRLIDVQVWGTVTLTDAQIVTLAEGITVPDDAVGTAG